MSTTETESKIEEARRLLTESREYLGTITTGDWSLRRDEWLKLFAEPLTHEQKVSIIKRRVVEFFGLKPDDMTSPARPERIAWPRQIAMVLCRRAGMTCQAVAHEFNRDRATVIHAERTLARRTETNATDRDNVRKIEEALKLILDSPPISQ